MSKNLEEELEKTDSENEADDTPVEDGNGGDLEGNLDAMLSSAHRHHLCAAPPMETDSAAHAYLSTSSENSHKGHPRLTEGSLFAQHDFSLDTERSLGSPGEPGEPFSVPKAPEENPFFLPGRADRPKGPQGPQAPVQPPESSRPFDSDSTTVLQSTKVALLRKYFFNRIDRVGCKTTGKPAPMDVKDEAHLGRLLLHHVRGACRLGSYAPGPDQNTYWLCYDFDGGGEHASPLTDPAATALQVQWALSAQGVTSYLERSGGGAGYHLWVFFEFAVPASLARALGYAFAPKDAPLAGGGVADAHANKGVEVFPKQDTIAPTRLGNMVYLPFWGGGLNGGGQFFRDDGAGGLTPFVPEAFTPTTEAKARAVVDALTPKPKFEAPSPVVGQAAEARSRAAPSPAGSGSPTGKAAWKAWRVDALNALPLEAVFGTFLTGKTNGSGWLECRDPSSPTGDRNPSASVADVGAPGERGSFHSFVTGKTVSVFDFLIDQGRASGFIEAARLVSELSGVPLPKSKLPEIMTGQQLRDMVEEGWGAVLAANEPEPILFRFGTVIARVLADPTAPPRVEAINQAYLVGLLTRHADWFKMTRSGAAPALPPVPVAQDMLALPHDQLPVLEGLGSTPVFGRSGSLILRPGYSPDDRFLLCDTRGLALPSVSRRPSPQELATARILILDELLGDFPFVSESDRAHAMAALLLPFARRLVRGCTPAHMIEAPMPGSGKGLLCDCISLIATGLTANSRALPSQDDEIRKMLLAELLRARPVILLDNVAQGRELDSPSLAAVLTSELFSDRVLGISQMVSVPNQALWLMTGNNPKFTSELARRVVRVRLDPQVDRPWQRTGFKHPDLKAWLHLNRGRLVHACLTLVQNWVAQGRQEGKATLGSFENWARVMSGILQGSGVNGFLGNLEEMYEAADAEGQDWREFVAAWHNAEGTRSMRVNELNALCARGGYLLTQRGDGSPQSQLTKLGLALGEVKDRIINGLKVTLVEDNGNKGKLYALRPAPGPTCK